MKISELNGLTLPEKEDYIPIVDNSEKETKKATMTALLNLFYPVGSYYETSDAEFNPNTSWGGTWKLDNDGTVLVSQSLETGSVFATQLSKKVGEEKHLLTIDEMPSHKHDKIQAINGTQTLTTGESADFHENGMGVKNNTGSLNTSYKEPVYTSNTGGGQAHSIVQPSKVVNRWHREA